MKLKNLCVITIIVSSLFLIATFSVEAETITDGTGDVGLLDYLTGNASIVTSSPYINVDNLDLIKATYTQQGMQATLSLQVKGNIENRGTILDLINLDNFTTFDSVEYEFRLTTSEQDYSVTYSNNTGQLLYESGEQINLTSSDFSVVSNTLTIFFTLTSTNETYTNLSVTSTYIKANLSAVDSSGMVYLSDVAPNPSLAIYEAYASNLGSIGEKIQFNASVEPLTGQPPYTYHWDFGDKSTSTQLQPTHAYTKAGVYTYNFTVTDNAGTTAFQSGNITISSAEGGGGGGAKEFLSTQMILFLAILLIIIVIGVVVIVWIIRR
jgi:hypothetical protein